MGSQRSIDSFLKMKAVILLALFIAGCSALHGNIEKQIVSGYEAGICEFPHMAYLLMKKKDGTYISCGGSLINANHILTAAHCIVEAVGVTAYLGHANKNKSPQRIKASKWVYRPGYKHGHGNILNDVAMVRLSKPAKLGSCVKTISLPAKDQMFRGTCIAAGWGRLSNSQQGPIHMRKTEIKVVPYNNCQWYGYNVQRDQHICVGDRTNMGKNICQGDSGGPLMCKAGNRMVVAGVASYIFNCEKGFGVYANVAGQMDW